MSARQAIEALRGRLVHAAAVVCAACGSTATVQIGAWSSVEPTTAAVVEACKSSGWRYLEARGGWTCPACATQRVLRAAKEGRKAA